jgi:heptosyltransferase-1
LHLAAAYGVPLAAIFIASDPGLTGPVGAGRIVVVAGIDRPPTAAETIAAVERLLWSANA